MTDNIINIEEGKKIYFASDFHLGIPDHDSSLVREKKIVAWLDQCAPDAQEIYLMGDIFDFWFEYRSVVPKGYVRLLGKLGELSDAGIHLHLFKGNHDIWAFDYFNKELGIAIHRKAELTRFNDKIFYLGHGDGLGPGDNGYKFLKKVFENRCNQWLFRWLHPDIGARMALYFSGKSRYANMTREGRRETPIEVEDEMLYKYSMSLAAEGMVADYYVFGHRHVPLQVNLNASAQLIILGDWLNNFTYAEFDGNEMKLKQYSNNL